MYTCYSCEWMFISYIIHLFKKASIYIKSIYSVRDTVLSTEEETKDHGRGHSRVLQSEVHGGEAMVA